MDNHQLELAEKFYTEGYSLYCVPNDLQKTLQSLNPERMKHFKEFPASSAYKFNNYLENIFGYSTK